MSRTPAALLLLAGIVAAPPAHAEGVFGNWLTESKKAIISIAPCGALACGTIIWMDEPLDASGLPKKDTNNPDPSLRDRGLCGLPLIGNFESGADGEWENGFIYDPTEGETYKSKMRITEEGNLYVRGYVGIPLFGKSQLWTPVTSVPARC